MLPPPLIRLSEAELAKGRIEPAFAGEGDRRTVAALLEACQACSGTSWLALDRAAAGAAAIAGIDRRFAAGLLRTIAGWMGSEAFVPAAGAGPGSMAPPPSRVREAVFEAAGATPDDPGSAWAEAARILGVAAVGPAHLHGDLRENRVPRFAGPVPAPEAVAALYNLRLLQGLLAEAAEVVLEAAGSPSGILRIVGALGLIGGARRGRPGRTELTLAGPASLVRRRRRYARALAALLGRVAPARLSAGIAVRGRWGRLEIPAGRRALPALPPPPEEPIPVRPGPEALARDLRRLAAPWSAALPEVPLAAGRSLLLPDLDLRLAGEARPRASVIVGGFWTRRSIEEIRALAAAAGRPMVLCIDGRLQAGEEGPPEEASPGFRCLAFPGRPAATAVLEALKALEPVTRPGGTASTPGPGTSAPGGSGSPSPPGRSSRGARRPAAGRRPPARGGSSGASR